MWKLLQNLIWPAVAGNVVWAFFTVAIAKWSKFSDDGFLVLAQLVALAFLGLYLAADWLYTVKKNGNMRPCCWPFDAFLAIAIAVSAIALSQDNAAIQVAKCTMALAFLIAAIGHCFGAWETIEGTNYKDNNKWLAIINLSGLAILFIFSLELFSIENDLWPLSIAIVFAVVWYLAFAACKMRGEVIKASPQHSGYRCVPAFIATLLFLVVLGGGFCISGYGKDEPLGGPYSIGGNKNDSKITKDKMAEFDGFKKLSWDSTTVVEFTDKIFTDSIKSNRAQSGVPYTDQFQRYNYVIKDGKIFVAVWDPKNASGICRTGVPPNTKWVVPYANMKIDPGKMVNFYPESLKNDLLLNVPTSLALATPSECSYSDTKQGKTTGVLDAHSKHFMLAQGIGNRISKFNTVPGWEGTKVDYAGEIVVNINPCYYVINQGSGTYRPNPDFKYLDRAAEIFTRTVNVAPKFVWRTDTGGEFKPSLSTSIKLDCGP